MGTRTGFVTLLVAAALGATSCGSGTDGRPLAASTRDALAPATAAPATAGSHEPVTIAFAGDVHFAGQLASRLSDPGVAMGPLTARLAEADLSIVNLETAVTLRGAPQPKQFTFRAAPVVFRALVSAGIDVATMANNHGMDGHSSQRGSEAVGSRIPRSAMICRTRSG